MNILSYVIFFNKLLLIFSINTIVPGTFWHFSDVFWNSSPEVCNNKTVESCVTKLLKSILQQGGGIIPDFIFWTCAGGHYIESVANAFKAAVNNITVVPSLARLHKNSSSNYTLLSNYFSSWLDETALKTFIKHGYYTISPKIPKYLKIIVLNSELLCEPRNSTSVGDSDNQWSWLFLELSNARKDRLKVYILTSIAPGITTTFEEKQFTLQENKLYIKMVRLYCDIIKGQFAGYENGNKFQIFTYENGTSCNWLMLAPPFINSSRLYIYNIKTLDPLDYIQFYKSNESWLMENRFTNFFLVPNISTFSLDLLVQRMKTSNELLAKYTTAGNQFQELNGQQPLCKITAIDYDEYLNCIRKIRNPIHTTLSPHQHYRSDCTTNYNNYFTIPLIFILIVLL